MPNGETHLRLYKKNALWSIPLLAAGSYIATQDPLFAGLTVVGYGLGYYISPDLDLIGLNTDEGRMMRHFPVIGHIFVAWWFLYAGVAQIFGGHRSKFSHSYLIGAFFRLVWMFLPIIFLWLKYSPIEISLELFTYRIFLPLWLGLSAADAVHIRADFA